MVMVVGKRLLDSERAYFTAQRQEYRREAQEDRAELKTEIRELREENRRLEERLDTNRDQRLDGPGTVQLPALRQPPLP